MAATETNTTNNQTSYVCLFHSHNQAEAAVRDLENAGISRGTIQVIGETADSGNSAFQTTIQRWNLPERDTKHLVDQVNKGAVIVAVAGNDAMDSQIESVFHKNKAKQIDETDTAVPLAAGATAAAAVPQQATTTNRAPVSNAAVGNENDVIEVVEEDIQVGKRRVQTGGVRVFARVVETPVQEAVALQEEHVHIDRHPVNQAINPADADLFRERRVEVTETVEEPVVAKSARVVEEVVVGKETTQHTERIQDSVRHTEVNVEELPATEVDPSATSTKSRKASV